MEKIAQEAMEEQILLLLDNELTAEAAEKVWAQIEAFPEYKALYEEYAAVYFDADEWEEKIDFSYLQRPEPKTVTAPMFVQRKLKPVWGVAASVALIVSLGLFFWKNNSDLNDNNHPTFTKSDRLNPVSQSPIQQLAQDSLEKQNKATKTNTPSKQKQQTVKENNETRLAKVEDADVAPTKPKIEPILVGNTTDGLQMVAFTKPTLDETTLAVRDKTAVHHAVAATEDSDFETRGLLSDMVKAGQWIFGERKQTTTVEFGIGNNENRKLKIKF